MEEEIAAPFVETGVVFISTVSVGEVAVAVARTFEAPLQAESNNVKVVNMIPVRGNRKQKSNPRELMKSP